MYETGVGVPRSEERGAEMRRKACAARNTMNVPGCKDGHP